MVRVKGKSSERIIPDYIEVTRGRYGFRDYTDVDCDDICHGDESGVVVYEEDNSGEWHTIAQVPTGITACEIATMTDFEFDGFLTENGIF